MAIQRIHPYYLRTTTGSEGVGYPTLEAAQAQVQLLLGSARTRGCSVAENTRGQWCIVEPDGLGSFVVWVTDDSAFEVLKRLTII